MKCIWCGGALQYEESTVFCSDCGFYFSDLTPIKFIKRMKVWKRLISNSRKDKVLTDGKPFDITDGKAIQAIGSNSDDIFKFIGLKYPDYEEVIWECDNLLYMGDMAEDGVSVELYGFFVKYNDDEHIYPYEYKNFV